MANSFCFSSSSLAFSSFFFKISNLLLSRSWALDSILSITGLFFFGTTDEAGLELGTERLDGLKRTGFS